MFDLEIAIKNWRAELQRQKVGGPEILDELESHLREEFDRLRGAKVTDEERFEHCAARIGNGDELKKEFRRLRWKRLWNFQEVPLSMKIVAACFIFRGLDFVVSSIFPRFAYGMISIPLIASMAIAVLPLLIGLGLLRRQNKWRVMAFVCTAFHVFVFVQGLLLYIDLVANPPLLPSGVSGMSISGALMGFRVPLLIRELMGFVNVAAMVWGCFILAKPSVRNLFRNRATA